MLPDTHHKFGLIKTVQYMLKQNLTQITTYLHLFTSTMKLYLLLFTSLFNLSSGFEVFLKGRMNEKECTGGEYAKFESCVMDSVESSGDSSLQAQVAGGQGHGDGSMGKERGLQSFCSACPPDPPLGHFCYYFCNGNGRRLDEGTDTPSLRRGQEVGEAKLIADSIMGCLDNYSCLGEFDIQVIL
jgi:hypothetical protein